MMIFNFAITQLLKFLILFTIGYFAGVLATQKNVKVNYTRKINHFSMFLVPMVLNELFPYVHNKFYFILNLALTTAFFLILLKPIRDKHYVISIIFSGIDRPEDRPHTLPLLFSQTVFGYFILAVLYLLLNDKMDAALIYIPVLITVIGDGIAEPIGVKFGRHKYRVPSLVKGKSHFRTIEGSLAVFLVSLIVIYFLYPVDIGNFWAVLFSLPFLMTITEALSPHTWDTPFLFLVGGLSLYLIH